MKKFKILGLILAIALVFAGVPTFANISIEYIGDTDPGYYDGFGSPVRFRGLNDIALDEEGGYIYVADTGNHCIRRIKLTNLEVTTFAGSAAGLDSYGNPAGGYKDGKIHEALFNAPRGISIMKNGAIIIADTGNNAIRKIHLGNVTTVAGGKRGRKDGMGKEAQFNMPSDVISDSFENIYVADTGNNVLRKIDRSGKVQTISARFNSPTKLNRDNLGRILISESGTGSIRVFSDGQATVMLGGGVNSYRNGTQNRARFNRPGSIVYVNRSYFIADTFNHSIRRLYEGRVDTIMGAGEAGSYAKGTEVTRLNAPTGLVYYGNKLFVTDKHNNRIVVVNMLNKAEPIIPFERDGEFKFYVDGVKMTFKDNKPFAVEGVSYIPLRSIAEFTGGKLGWIQKTQTVTFEMDGKKVELPASEGVLQFRDGVSYARTSTLVKKLGFKVKWNQRYTSVVISTD